VGLLPRAVVLRLHPESAAVGEAGHALALLVDDVGHGVGVVHVFEGAVLGVIDDVVGKPAAEPRAVPRLVGPGSGQSDVISELTALHCVTFTFTINNVKKLFFIF
jgi:hypothetical protein